MITKSKVKYSGSRIEKMWLRSGAMDETRLAEEQSLWNETKDRKAKCKWREDYEYSFLV